MSTAPATYPPLRLLRAALVGACLACIHVFATEAPDGALAEAAGVRSLSPDEARRPHRVRIRGVVTTSNARSCVVQDASGPVFVRPSDGSWTRRPSVGEAWEFAGLTDPGEFSPIIIAAEGIRLGEQTPPSPIHPTREQLLNGSLDVELIEVVGVVVTTTSDEMILLTHGGEVTIKAHPDYPLPRPASPADGNQAPPGGRVRVRGVFFAYRDPATRHLSPGRFLLGDGTFSVDAPAPADPFAGPARRVADLLRFSSRADLLSRVKIVGQVLHARPGELLLFDGENGFRARVKGAPEFARGELVEVVGFPQLGGPSPVLLEAAARKTGSGTKPAPRVLDEAGLTDDRHDASLVRIEARLLAELAGGGERVLELQAGRHRFLARLPVDEPSHGAGASLRPGARLRLTGVYASLHGDAARGGESGAGLELLLARPADIEVLTNGPWWTPHRTRAAIAVLLAGLAAALVWIVSLRRTVARRTALLEREIRERQRAEQGRLLEEERARIAQDLHDDLGAGLAQIGLVGALARRPGAGPEHARTHLIAITEKAREMVAVLDEIVWAINPRHDTAGSVTGYLCDYAQEFLRASAIVCRIDADCARPTLALGSAPRHQLFLAFKEALTNVVKHAEASEVRVRIATSDAGLDLIVEDNGKGPGAPSGRAKGDGLAGLRARLQKLGGSCEIKARVGGGTTVCFHLPASPVPRVNFP